MKRFLVLLMAVLLLLAGCTAQDVEESSGADTTAATAETTPPGLYVPDSAVEHQTGGAVRLYHLEDKFYRELSAIGDQLLLISGEDPITLTVLSGADCVPVASTQIAADQLSGSFHILYNGVGYYCETSREAVFLDSQLHEVDRVKLPEDIQGNPMFSPDGGEIFYCVDHQIRGLDVQRGISRLIKSHSYTSQMLLGCYFEGKIVACHVEDAQGHINTVYVSTETGQTEAADDNFFGLSTYENQFLSIRKDGTVWQRIVGTADSTPVQLNVAEDDVTGALALGGVVGSTVDANNGLNLSFYETVSGKKTASVLLRGVGDPQCFWADRWSGCLWLLAKDPATNKNALLRWDIKLSSTTDETVYTGTLYTANTPDEAGLDACNDRVSQLNKTHGVRIRIWQDAVKNTGSYSLVPEYQTQAINSVLDALEPVLAEFPKNFLLKSVNNKIRICIVRSVDGEAKAVQYWDNGDAYLVLSPGVDVRTEFMKAMGYVVNSHVLGNSPIVDAWTGMNPEGFVYGETTVDDYLKGDERAFVDEASMQSVTEDRSRIFWQAMLADNAEMFKTDIMQQKLLLLCKGIRDAWGLERNEEVYPWEQYLNESIAYQK